MKNLIYIILFFTCVGNSQSLMLLDNLRQQQISVEPSYILDTYNGSLFAYSFRKLKFDAVNCVEIRRSSDNATTVVLLENTGEITLSSLVSAGGDLSTWVGSDDAFVRTWYDQSGNSLDISETTNNLQPKLISLGALINNSNGNVSARFFDDAEDDRLYRSQTFTSSSGMLFCVQETSSGNSCFFNDNSGGNNYISVCQSGSGASPNSLSGTPSYYINNTAISSATRNDLYVNYISTPPNIVNIETIDFTGWDGFEISGYVGLAWQGMVSEVIVFDNDGSLNRSDIVLTINSTYSIF